MKNRRNSKPCTADGKEFNSLKECVTHFGISNSKNYISAQLKARGGRFKVTLDNDEVIWIEYK
jgi:hypothetical protein